MSRRFRHLGAVAVALVGLVGGQIPPATATTGETIVFTLVVTLGATFSHPCLPLGHTPGLCPALGPVTTLPLVTGTVLDIVPNFSLGFGGNATPYVFTAPVCLATGVHIAKLTKPITHVPPALCAFGGGGMAMGHCGLSGFDGTADLIVLGQVLTIAHHAMNVGGVLIVSGHAVKTSTGQTGLFFGLASMLTPPDITTFPIGNNCVTKTAVNSIVPGGGHLVLL